MLPDLLVSILSGEAPLDSALQGISRCLPCIDFAVQRFAIGDSSVQTLAAQNADLDLRHAQPARALWRVVKLHPAQ